jgi:ribonucleoside-diphosphate reductase alpha chain
VFLDDTACNLASINLARLHVDGAFRVAAYEHAIRVWTIVLDISVSMAGYPTAEIARRSMLYRTLGLGYAALGELLVLMDQGYGTAEGRSTAAFLTETLTLVAYSTSVDLAERLGAFPRYAANRDHVLDTIRKHADAGNLRRSWADVLERARVHGVRNAQVTLLAPCGTIGIVMDCETTGVEPFYSDTTFKSLAGGGMMRLASKRFADALTLQGYDVDAHTRRAWTVEQGRVREYVWIEPPPDLADVLVCASDLTPEQHVAMMAAVQPFLSGAISKTVNMPSESTVDDVARMYTVAWRSGLKSIAIYRDGCKPAQPLQGRKPAPGVKTFPNREVAETFLAALQRAGFDATTLHASAPKLAARSLARGDRHEPPAIASAIKHRVELSGHTFYLTLAEYSDGSLAEVFVTCSRTGSAISGWVNTWAKVFSLALQHGTPLAVLVSAMSGESFEPVGYHDARPVQSPVDCFARIIAARYLGEPSETPDTEIAASLPAPTPALPSAKPTGATCTGCGSSDLTRSGACFVCRKCGSTTGCS